MDFDICKLVRTRTPKCFEIQTDRITITTAPHTDLWQRTYYGFRAVFSDLALTECRWLAHDGQQLDEE